MLMTYLATILLLLSFGCSLFLLVVCHQHPEGPDGEPRGNGCGDHAPEGRHGKCWIRIRCGLSAVVFADKMGAGSVVVVVVEAPTTPTAF